MDVSRCRFWFCHVCNAVLEKPELLERIECYRGPVFVRGTLECGNCHTIVEQADVYAGKHDLPQRHWEQFQAATGQHILIELE